MTRALVGIALVASAWLAGGCSGGPGAFCTADTECRAGLRCSGSAQSRGICTYPPSGTADSTVRDATPQERHPVEARPVEARPVEARPVEAGPLREAAASDRVGEPAAADLIRTQ